MRVAPLLTAATPRVGNPTNSLYPNRGGGITEPQAAMAKGVNRDAVDEVNTSRQAQTPTPVFAFEISVIVSALPTARLHNAFAAAAVASRQPSLRSRTIDSRRVGAGGETTIIKCWNEGTSPLACTVVYFSFRPLGDTAEKQIE